jgi:hypothetical protein
MQMSEGAAAEKAKTEQVKNISPNHIRKSKGRSP